MIVVYPMLTSGNVNPNIIPGLAKSIEKYTIVYNTDDILKVVNGNIATVFKYAAPLILSAGAIVLAPKITDAASKLAKKLFESENVSEIYPGTKTQTGNQDDSETKEDNLPKTRSPIKTGSAKLDIPKSFPESLSLEPTWLQLNTDIKGLQIVGVKVVPFTIQSPTPIIDLMMQDINLKSWALQSQKISRKIKSLVFRFLRIVPGLKGKAMSGDPKKDIVHGSTQYGKSMFIALSNLDMEQSAVFSNPMAVKKLQKLGWASFIITDDVNKSATFCMKEFGGICSQLPYSYIMASQGKGQHEVYKDLEDVKRSAGPFFRMSTNRKKMFSEATVSKKYNSFRNLLD